LIIRSDGWLAHDCTMTALHRPCARPLQCDRHERAAELELTRL